MQQPLERDRMMQRHRVASHQSPLERYVRPLHTIATMHCPNVVVIMVVGSGGGFDG